MRDERDLIYELKLDYRFFPQDSSYGDFAGLAVGFKNDHYGAFSLGGAKGEESLELHDYSVFATLDLSLLKITAGNAFGGREVYRETTTRDVGEGVFLSVQGMIPF